jgi:hypothetical protein
MIAPHFHYGAFMSFRITRALRPALAIMAVVAAAGCGSSTTDDGGNSNGACSIKLTGAVTATYACTVPAFAAYTPGDGESAIGFSYTAGTSNTVAVAIGFTAQIAKGTYTNATSTITGGVTVTNGSNSWYAIAGGGTTTGTFTLTITSLTTLGSTTSGTSYTAHGTLTGTLPPTAGTGASVTVNATF